MLGDTKSKWLEVENWVTLLETRRHSSYFITMRINKTHLEKFHPGVAVGRADEIPGMKYQLLPEARYIKPHCPSKCGVL